MYALLKQINSIGGKVMLESVGIAIFIMCVVFAVLFGIYICVRLFSMVTMKIEEGLRGEETKKTN